MRKLLITLTLFCSVILLVGAQSGFAKPKKTMIDAAEICFNGMDDDGNGFTDCADSACANLQNGSCPAELLGICAEGTLTCVAGEEQCVPNNQPVPEVCDDGLDNDCDGAVDLNDLDCAIEGNKVTICHIPRGNPAKAHIIKVAVKSLPAHLAHGDTIGTCPENSSRRPKKTGRLFKGV